MSRPQCADIAGVVTLNVVKKP